MPGAPLPALCQIFGLKGHTGIQHSEHTRCRNFPWLCRGGCSISDPAFNRRAGANGLICLRKPRCLSRLKTFSHLLKKKTSVLTVMAEVGVHVFFNLREMRKHAGTAEAPAANCWSSRELAKDRAVPMQPLSSGRSVNGMQHNQLK